jgi:predicted amidohydrolase
MMQHLKVTLIQSDLYWQNAEANLSMFEEKIWEIGESTDLIVLPEMFNTGFTMDVAKAAEMINGRSFRWMKQMAAQMKAVVTGSLIIKEAGIYYNRLVWMEPDGNHYHYDKRHLFRLGNEDQYYQAGESRLIRKIRNWKIMPLICYDLRFPVWSRNIFNENQQELDYDLLIYIANWPGARINAWDTLLQARAIENQSYVVGVNRIGEDGNGISYNGHSTVINPKGRRLFYNEDKPTAITLSFEYEKLIEFRKKFPVYLDQDKFKLDN